MGCFCMKCFYHCDMDGRCSGNIVSNFEDNACVNDFIEVDYVKPIPIDIISNKERVYFVDYSFTESTYELLLKLIDMGCDVIWIDHHTSSINLINSHPELNNIKGLRIDGISGAALTYMYLFGVDYDFVPYYVKLVSDYDCWKFKYEPNTMFFKLGMDTFDDSIFSSVWNKLYDGSKMRHCSYSYKIIDTGRVVKKYKDKSNESMINTYGYESTIDNTPCYVINRRSDSTIFGKLYDVYPLVATWVFNGDKYSYSLYSGNKDIDCSKIAEKFGGGGHKGASGFSSDKMILTKRGDIIV